MRNMKKEFVFISVILIFSFFRSESQDKIDPPKLPYFNYVNYIYNNFLVDTAYFPYDKNFDQTLFVKGWNWGTPGAHLDSALGINFYHDMPLGYGQHDFKYYMRVAKQMGGVTGGRQCDNIFNAQYIYLEPTLIVDSTENFKGRYGDSTGAVFGFKSILKTNICKACICFGDNIY